MTRKVVVDTDPCLFYVGHDVDDDLALLFLLASPEVEVIAVTTTYGNSLGAFTHRDARRLLAAAGRADIPVARGAGHLSRDTRETAASRLLVETVKRHAGDVTLLTLGPLTNLRAAVAAWPELPQHLVELVVMGGRSESGLSEFNFRCDPAAADRTMALPARKIEIAFDLIFPIVLTPADVGAFTANEVLRPHVAKLRRFARFQDVFRGLRGRSPGQASGGFHPWDGVAASWLVAPHLFSEPERVLHRVDSCGRSQLAPFAGDGAPVLAPRAVDVAGFRQLFLERLTRRPG